MLNIADLNIYLYQKKKTHLIKCFGCWLHARISRIADIPGTTTIIDGYKIYSSTVVPARH